MCMSLHKQYVCLCVCLVCVYVYTSGLYLGTNTVTYFFSFTKIESYCTILPFLCHKCCSQSNCQTTLRGTKPGGLIILGPPAHYQWSWEK